MFPTRVTPPPLCLISGLSKSHLCILIIKHSVKLSHKYITQNPLGSSRNVHSHHGEQTSPPRLNHKILSWDTPRLTINGEVELGESRQLGAINGVLSQQVGLCTNGGGNLLDFQGGSSDEGGTTIDNTVGLSGGVGSGGDIVKGDLPVFWLFEFDPCDFSLELGFIDPTKGQLPLLIIPQSKGKLPLVHHTLIHGILKYRLGVSKRQALESKPHNTIKLAKRVPHAQSTGITNLGEFLTLDNNILCQCNIVNREGTLDITRPVLNVKVSSIRDISGRFGVIKLVLPTVHEPISTVLTVDLGNP
mmetsp:Transcript_20944/g.31232  ORF Transcript_20944/g.31232 Transcript_20944/m.31232 type:complete len:303 (-) Transcript_20944:474-1382(-)